MTRVLGWLVWDTFRQAIASRLFWLMLTITIACVGFCLSLSIDKETFKMKDLKEDPLGAIYGPDGKELAESRASLGEMRLGFGLFRVRNFRDSQSQIHFVQAILAMIVAGTIGTMLTLIWTGGFLPEFLQPAAASVLLAKPTSRSWILIGKFLGVMAFVAFQSGLFVFGTWAAIGLKTGYWMPHYLLSWPLLLLNFAIIQGTSTLLAVCTRNAIACIFGSILFWCLCFGMNYGRHASIALPEIAQAKTSQTASSTKTAPPAASQSRVASTLAEAGYWLLPKPADLAILLDQVSSMRGEGESARHLATPAEFDVVVRLGRFHPISSIAASLAFTVLMLALACREFSRMDY